ncbi:hypothetical protein HDU98_003285 [Podochytrium sp. JEL0797]|nr:hypothetical protein HDU98_003285 [Podochytrium sp. JEL0797]
MAPAITSSSVPGVTTTSSGPLGAYTGFAVPTASVNGMPTGCGAAATLPPQEPDLMLPSAKTVGFLGGNANLVFTVPNYGQTLNFATSTYTYTTGTRTVSGTGCVPTIVGWATTYRSSFVTSTLTSVSSGGASYYTPFLTATATPTTGCFVTATLAETDGCMVHSTATSTYKTAVGSVTSTPTVTVINGFGGLDVQANLGINEASEMYPFLVSYPYQASAVTIASNSINTAVTISVISEDFAITNGGTGAGTLNFVLSAVASDASYIVNSVVLTSPQMTGTYVTTASAPGRFSFSGISETCGTAVPNPITYQATAKLCRVGTAQTATTSGTCLSGAAQIDSSFSIVSTPNQVNGNCAFILTIGAISDISAAIVDITSSPPTPTLYATDNWQISLTSNSLQSVGQYINVTAVSIGDGSGNTLLLDGSCFTSVSTGYGTNIFSFPANILPLGVASYLSAAQTGFTPADQLCSNGFLIANKASTTYTFNMTLEFDGTALPGAPLRRRRRDVQVRQVAGGAGAGSQMPTTGAASLSLTVDTTGGQGGGAAGGGGSGKGVSVATVGGVVAGIVVVGGILFGVVVARRRKQKEEKKESKTITKGEEMAACS